MKFIIRTKNGYGSDIKRGVMSVIEENGSEYTEKIGPGCDFAVVIGGDGTLLTNQAFLDCPVLGINPGKSVGFYMAAGKDDYRKRVLSLITGKPGKDFHIHKVMRLEAGVNGKQIAVTALNDVLISPIFVRRVFVSNLRVGGRSSTEKNSGIIVYTPTGSHAFAHSAGAKQLPFGSDRFGVAALAPYSGELKKGEILIESGEVKVECLNETGEVSIDGSDSKIVELKKGDVVRVRKSGKPLELIDFSRRFDH